MMLLIDYVHELGAKIGLSEEETERIWFDVCGGDLKALANVMAVECCANGERGNKEDCELCHKRQRGAS